LAAIEEEAWAQAVLWTSFLKESVRKRKTGEIQTEVHMSAKSKEIMEKVNAAFAENNLEGFLSFCTDDVKWTMVGDKTVNGKVAIRQWMASMDFEPPRFTVDTVARKSSGEVITENRRSIRRSAS
jgi:hypothetical protein